MEMATLIYRDVVALMEMAMLLTGMAMQHNGNRSVRLFMWAVDFHVHESGYAIFGILVNCVSGSILLVFVTTSLVTNWLKKPHRRRSRFAVDEETLPYTDGEEEEP